MKKEHERLAIAKDEVTAILRTSNYFADYFKLTSFTPNHEMFLLMNRDAVEEYGKMLRNMPAGVTAMHHVDTSFEFDNRYLSVLSYRHHLLVRQNTISDGEGTEPTIPLFYYLHQRKSREDHEHAFYLARREIMKIIPIEFTNAPKILVTDREFKGDNYLPNTQHVYCWNHIRKNIEWHAGQSLKLPRDVQTLIKNDVYPMLMSSSEDR